MSRRYSLLTIFITIMFIVASVLYSMTGFAYAAEATADTADTDEVSSPATDTEQTQEAVVARHSEEGELKSGAVYEDGVWKYYVIRTSIDETTSQEVKSSQAMTGTGWIEEDGVKAYYMKSGKLMTGWYTVKTKVKYKKGKKWKTKTVSRKYFFNTEYDGTPRVSTGYTLINGAAYYFNTDVNSADYAVIHKSGAIKDEEDNLKYYVGSNGKLKTGWVAYDSKAYYFDKLGCIASDYTLNSNISFNEKGYIGGARGKAMYYMIGKMNKYGWSLSGAYKASYKLKYANRPYRPKTVAEGAIYGGSKGKGNCYVMNCCFHVMAEMLGYEVRQIKGSVGPWKAPHSWLEIKQDGKWHVYDANFRNETGRSGFKIYYGKKGTWRYNRTSNYLPKI